MGRKFLFLSLVFIFSFPRSVAPATAVPKALVKLPEKGPDYAVIVDKSRQKLFLFRRDDVSTPFRVYRCSTGENSGAKSRRHDKKTPEGVYFFTDSYGERDLPPIYGTRALAIDYPNALDREQGRRGSGIWFHGTNKPLRPRDTNGCIVLDNRSIDELASFVTLHQTPVVVSPRIEWATQHRVRQESIALEEVIERWRRTWERKEIDDYMSLFSPQFSADGMNWHLWRAYKTRTVRGSGSIDIGVQNVQLLKTNGVVLARFSHAYRAPGYESKGEMRLYLVRNTDQWKVIGEFYSGRKGRRIVPH